MDTAHHLLLEIRDFIIRSEVALEKWPRVVDRVVKTPDDRIKIKKLIRLESEYGEAVLSTLKLWFEYGSENRADLLNVLGDLGLNRLEELIRELLENSGHLEVDCTPSKKRKTELLSSAKWWPEKKEPILTFVPRRCPDGKLITELIREQLLASGGERAAVANKHTILGMGGIGKSSTAKWYGNVHADEYDHIIWIDSEATQLQKSIHRLAREFKQLDMNDELQYIARAIYQKLDSVKCLFVFDNAEGFDVLQNILPKGKLHHSLITSRNQEWGNEIEFGKIPAIQLGVFTPEEAMDLFSRVFPDINESTRKDALELGEELGFLPLALLTAIASIKKSPGRYTIREYLERWRRDSKVVTDRKVLNAYETKISTTLQMSIEQIQQSDEIEKNVKEMCVTILNSSASLSPDDIPINLFLDKSSAAIDIVHDALDVLVSYSLVVVYNAGHRNTTFSIHRLLQHVLLNTQLGDKLAGPTQV